MSWQTVGAGEHKYRPPIPSEKSTQVWKSEPISTQVWKSEPISTQVWKSETIKQVKPIPDKGKKEINFPKLQDTISSTEQKPLIKQGWSTLFNEDKDTDKDKKTESNNTEGYTLAPGWVYLKPLTHEDYLRWDRYQIQQIDPIEEFVRNIKKNFILPKRWRGIYDKDDYLNLSDSDLDYSDTEIYDYEEAELAMQDNDHFSW